MRLQAVEPRRLYRQIADQIRTLIGKGEVAPGARLPAERDLARQLGVSRPSLREALIALEVEGLLDVRVGSGIYVSQADGRGRGAEIAGASGPFEVIRARWLIEGECAALAARHGSPAQLRAIRKAHADLEKEAKRHHNPLDADRRFHVRIAEATGNSALELVVQTLWDQRVGPLYRALESKLEYPAMAAETIGEHESVLEAILERDPAAARSAMRRHMDMTKKRYSKDWKEAGK
ncbi:MAG TPA: FadR/GntR family transcriptional regulator [Burkholderiales bacterium]|nr:FadR/GntR family transcriptional regulator [Burkholderiales bacterium]